MAGETYIPCLLIRGGMMYQHFVDIDRIKDLDIVDTKAGRLRYVLSQTINGQHYRFWVRRTGKHCKLLRAKIDPQMGNVCDKIKYYTNQPQRYTEIIIVAYTDDKFTTPRFIRTDDCIVEIFDRWHSLQLKQWIAKSNYCGYDGETGDIYGEEDDADANSS